MRLGQWGLEKVQESSDELRRDNHDLTSWDGVQMGILQMNISSLHVFDGDMGKMRREAPAKP